jgi:hypothetical protein
MQTWWSNAWDHYNLSLQRVLLSLYAIRISWSIYQGGIRVCESHNWGGEHEKTEKETQNKRRESRKKNFSSCLGSIVIDCVRTPLPRYHHPLPHPQAPHLYFCFRKQDHRTIKCCALFISLCTIKCVFCTKGLVSYYSLSLQATWRVGEYIFIFFPPISIIHFSVIISRSIRTCEIISSCGIIFFLHCLCGGELENYHRKPCES